MFLFFAYYWIMLLIEFKSSHLNVYFKVPKILRFTFVKAYFSNDILATTKSWIWKNSFLIITKDLELLASSTEPAWEKWQTNMFGIM